MSSDQCIFPKNRAALLSGPLLSTFIGLDLAWSPRNRTGAAVVVGDERGGHLVDACLLGDDAEVAAYVRRHAGSGPAIVAVDAPLRVPNQSGRRPADAAITRAFGRFEAGTHPVNRRLLAFDGVVRGEALVAALAAEGFVHTPTIAPGVPLRCLIEVFPHPAMVVLFGLERTLKYKKAGIPNRRVEAYADWRRFQMYLLALSAADPPLRGQAPFLAQDVTQLRGRRLKDYEDQVDALMCAYIALYAYRWGDARCRAFGDMEGGYVYTPVDSGQWTGNSGSGEMRQ